MMKISASPKRRLVVAFGLLLVAAWEAYWLHEYVVATRPDYEMRSVAALLFGGLIPVALIGSITIFAAISTLLRRNGS